MAREITSRNMVSAWACWPKAAKIPASTRESSASPTTFPTSRCVARARCTSRRATPLSPLSNRISPPPPLPPPPQPHVSYRRPFLERSLFGSQRLGQVPLIAVRDREVVERLGRPEAVARLLKGRQRHRVGADGLAVLAAQVGDGAEVVGTAPHRGPVALAFGCRQRARETAGRLVNPAFLKGDIPRHIQRPKLDRRISPRLSQLAGPCHPLPPGVVLAQAGLGDPEQERQRRRLLQLLDRQRAQLLDHRRVAAALRQLLRRAQHFKRCPSAHHHHDRAYPEKWFRLPVNVLLDTDWVAPSALHGFPAFCWTHIRSKRCSMYRSLWSTVPLASKSGSAPVYQTVSCAGATQLNARPVGSKCTINVVVSIETLIDTQSPFSMSFPLGHRERLCFGTLNRTYGRQVPSEAW